MSKLPAYQTISADEYELMGMQILNRQLEGGRRPAIIDASSRWEVGPLNITCWSIQHGTVELKDKITGQKVLWQTIIAHRAFVKEKRPDGLVVYINDTVAIGRRDKPRLFRIKKDGKLSPDTKQFLETFYDLGFFPKLPRLTFDEERALKMFHVFSKLYKYNPQPL